MKLLASAPVILPLGLTASPILRYLKPTMSPMGFFDPSDLPHAGEEIGFSLNDFALENMCIPFVFPLKYTEFNPEQYVIREIPSFCIQLEKGHIVAYSRVCPYRGCTLNFVPDLSKHGCGCAPTAERCSCFRGFNTPALMCPCDLSTFDLANGGRVIRGPAGRAPRKFDLEFKQDMIVVLGLEDYPLKRG